MAKDDKLPDAKKYGDKNWDRAQFKNSKAFWAKADSADKSFYKAYDMADAYYGRDKAEKVRKALGSDAGADLPTDKDISDTAAGAKRFKDKVLEDSAAGRKQLVDSYNTRGYAKGGKVKKMAKGGSVSSASKRADGCATKGKTRGRFI